MGYFGLSELLLVDMGMSGILPAVTALFNASTHAWGMSAVEAKLAGKPADHSAQSER